jgi:hypothetical protein
MCDGGDRRSAHLPVVLMATVELGGGRIPVRVGSLSAHGALVIGSQLPSAECEIAFLCNGVATRSWVVWVRERHAGIQFEHPIDTERLLRNAPLFRPAITPDTRKLDFKKLGFRGNQLDRDEKRFIEEWMCERRA